MRRAMLQCQWFLPIETCPPNVAHDTETADLKAQITV